MKIGSERGAAVVEFAVILPLLLLILFGIIEFGFIFYNKALTTNASREGARQAILYRINNDGDRIFSPGNVVDTINGYLSPGGNSRLVSFGNNTFTIDIISDDGLSIINAESTTPDVVSDISNDQITVRINYIYDFLLIPSLVGINDTISVDGLTTMRGE